MAWTPPKPALHQGLPVIVRKTNALAAFPDCPILCQVAQVMPEGWLRRLAQMLRVN